MQKFLAPFPLVRIVVPFAIGIAIGLRVELNFFALIISLVILFSTKEILSRFIRRSSSLYAWHGSITFLFFAVTGLTLVQFNLNSFRESVACVEREVPVVVKIISDPETRESNVRCKARVIGIVADSAQHSADAVTMLLSQTQFSS